MQMHRQLQSFNKLIVAIVFGCILLVSQSAQASHRPLEEQKKIEAVLSAMVESNATFVRNGAEHSAVEAVEHLKKKLDYAGDRVQTARDFIEGLASKSSFSGQPYYVKLANGQQLPSSEWLYQQLNQLEHKS